MGEALGWMAAQPENEILLGYVEGVRSGDSLIAALETAQIWAKNAPDNLDAQRATAIQLARAGQYERAMQVMEKVLQAQGDTHFDFLALSAAETDPDTRNGLLHSFDRLLLKYPENGQLLFGKALLLQQDGKPEAALQLLEAHNASSQEVTPLLLRVRLLQALQRADEAMPLLEDGIRLHPDEKRLRLTYARLLVEQERMDDARAEFASLVQQFPEDDDLRLSLALVCMENQDWLAASAYFEELIGRNAHVDAAHFNLGRAYEERNEPDNALNEYAQVGPGTDYLTAQMRQTEILLGAKRIEEASNRLSKARDEQPDYAIQLYLIETEALAKHQHIDRAWRIAEQALLQYPDDLNLLYTRAMLAEKRNDLAQLEADLRSILAREPENAMALNALGYTLADRTTRYAEARALIEQAHQRQIPEQHHQSHPQHRQAQPPCRHRGLAQYPEQSGVEQRQFGIEAAGQKALTYTFPHPAPRQLIALRQHDISPRGQRLHHPLRHIFDRQLRGCIDHKIGLLVKGQPNFVKPTQGFAWVGGTQQRAGGLVAHALPQQLKIRPQPDRHPLL